MHTCRRVGAQHFMLDVCTIRSASFLNPALIRQNNLAKLLILLCELGSLYSVAGFHSGAAIPYTNISINCRLQVLD